MSELTHFSATTLRKMIRDRAVSPPEVVAAFYDRIVHLNPDLNPIVSLREREAVLQEAAHVDPDAPLGGLPMAPKDLADTAGLTTTYGSPLFAKHVPTADSLPVKRMRDAGAVFLGKTNTPEFGLGSHTYNDNFGTTLNPYDRNRSAGGSSGGAAVALAARFLPVADGSDMMGSLRNPAGWTNTYGVRPSYGMVPSDPVGDSFHKQLSTSGPMAWHPSDLRLLLDTLATPDPLAPHPAPRQRPLPKVIRWIGDWNGHLPLEGGVLETCEAALTALTDLGFVVETATPKASPGALWYSWTTLRSWVLSGELGVHLDDPARRSMVKAEVVWEVERGRQLTLDDIQTASRIRADWFRELQSEDVLWALPSAQLFPFQASIEWPKVIAGRTMDTYHRWMEVVVAASLAGAPGISIPAGFHKGLPMGLQLFGPRGIDHGLIALAERYHEAVPMSATHAPDLGDG